MDTKLKNIRHSSVTKAIAFIIAIVSISFALTMTVSIMYETNKIESLIQGDYLKSNRLSYEISSTVHMLSELIMEYKGEENIQKGNTISEQEFKEEKKKLYVQKSEFIRYYDKWHWDYDFEEIRKNFGDDIVRQVESRGVDALYEHEKTAFEEEYKEEIDALHYNLIQEELKNYRLLLKSVEESEHINYYISDGENTFSNVENSDKGYFTGYKVYYTYDQEGVESFEQLRDPRRYGPLVNHDGVEKITLYFALSDEYVEQNIKSTNNQHNILKQWFTWMIVLTIVSSICIIYLFWVAGRKTEDDKVHLMLIDRLWNEVHIIIIPSVIAIWGGISFEVVRPAYENNLILSDIKSYFNHGFAVIFLISLAASGITLMLLLSLVRKLKLRTLIRGTFTYKVLSRIYRFISSIINGGPLVLKVAGAVVIYGIIVTMTTLVFWPLMVIFIGFTLYFILKKIRQFEEITAGVKAVRKGNLDHKIIIKGDNEFSKLAEDINAISQGLKLAVEQEVKSERMKAELVTNVSHDLKTPLTSIISYVELLSKEEDLPEHVKDYIKILSQKSDRLKTIIQDLFDLSKAASGSINLDIERLDFAKLMRQTLADLDEEITQSGLVFKVKIPEDGAYIMGDGSKLYRVFQNIINNALKYSLEGSRVYVELVLKGSNAKAVIKNTSSYEMTFTREEILERFTRGEVSRTTEGSGLGLSIAKSFTEICGGSFDITIDGDLFKAELNFKVIE